MPSLSSFKAGAKGSVTRTITDDTVREFASISGDTQPLHLDDDYASQTRFGRRIAHGALMVGMVSAVLGVEMTNDDTTNIFLGLEVSFNAPVFIGDEVKAVCVVTDVREDKPIVTLSVSCSKSSGEEVMKGKAVVYVDPHPIERISSD